MIKKSKNLLTNIFGVRNSENSDWKNKKTSSKGYELVGKRIYYIIINRMIQNYQAIDQKSIYLISQFRFETSNSTILLDSKWNVRLRYQSIYLDTMIGILCSLSLSPSNQSILYLSSTLKYCSSNLFSV